MTIIAAADGSALGNPGPAGWGWYIDSSRWAAGGWPRGTNNQGELVAVLDLLRQTAHSSEPLEVYCDSQYVINSLTKWLPGWKRKGWKKADGKPVLNVEIMQALDDALSGREVTFRWVKGHAGHELNERADALANSAAQAFSAQRKPATGPGFPGATAAAGHGPQPTDAAAMGHHQQSGDDVQAAPAKTEPEAPRTYTPSEQAVLELRSAAAHHLHPQFRALRSGRLPTAGQKVAEVWSAPPNSVFVQRGDGSVEVWTATPQWQLACVLGNGGR